MSYSTVLFSNLIFHILEIIRTLQIFNNFSSFEILVFQMVEFIFLFSKLLSFENFLIIAHLSIIIL